MSKGLEINVEIGLCTKDMAKENPIKDFEILIEEHKNKWSKQMYDYFKECLSIIKKELKEYEEMKAIKGTTTFDKAIEDTLINACPNVAKKLKAFDIIIKTLPAFVYAITNSKDYQDYSGHYISPIITQEQYDLLKEVLKDE